METYFTQNTGNGDRREEEKPEPGGDGLPERSSAPRAGSPEQDRPRLIADDTEAFEDQRTGIEASFQLEEEELYRSLKRIELCGSRRILSVTGAVLLVCPMALFLAEGLQTGKPSAFLQAVSWAMLSLLFLLGPLFTIHSRAKNCARSGGVRVRIYPDRVVTEQGAVRWKIPLDGTCEYVLAENVLVLAAVDPRRPGGIGPARVTVLPLRCFSPDELPEVQAMIYAGAKPRRKRGF